MQGGYPELNKSPVQSVNTNFCSFLLEQHQLDQAEFQTLKGTETKVIRNASFHL